MMKFRMGETVHHFYSYSSLVKARVYMKIKKAPPLCQGVMVEFYQISSVEGKEIELAPGKWEIMLKNEFPIPFEPWQGLPPENSVNHCIYLFLKAKLVNQRSYNYSHFQKNKIVKIVEDLITTDIIRPSSSPYASPTLLVKKKDSSWHFCVDYRGLHKFTVTNWYPISVVDELHGSTIFSKIDLKSGYHQICMNEDNIPKTAFWTHQGHFEFRVMPFGLSNAPTTF